MILVDTGPLVALFDPRDRLHERCRRTLRALTAPLVTTVPVLTEVFHMLSPNSVGAERVRDLIAHGGMRVWHHDDDALQRSFQLMDQYADQPMDLADASLVTAAERLGTRRVFTVDRRDFSAYRILRGHRHQAVEIVF